MIDTICIGSGGLKGISFISALNYLEKQNYINFKKINRYTCVSVGCIIGILLVIGYEINEIYNLTKEINYDDIKPCLNLDLMIDKYGFDNGENIIDWLINIMLKKINNPNISFLELYQLTKKEIYIATTNFSKNTEKIFNYKDTPNVPVILAIRMSISIPLIYTPVMFENDYYVDGALTNNVYIIKKSDPEKTLVIYVNKYKPPEILSIKDILLGSIFILCDQIIKKGIEKYNCLKIDCIDIVFSSEAEISKEIIELLILNGECSAENYLRNKLKYKIKKLKKDIKNKKSNVIKDTLNDIIEKIIICNK
jgi:predicted patatin/cPLA2 family phospholipase